MAPFADLMSPVLQRLRRRIARRIPAPELELLRRRLGRSRPWDGLGDGRQFVEGSVPRWPDLVGIGAQKSGTTFLASLLAQNPDYQPLVGHKELHILDEAWSGREDDIREAFRVPESRRDAPVVGEFTPSYLVRPWVPLLARDLFPEGTRFVAVLRDPIARLRSGYSHLIRHGAWPNSQAFAEALDHSLYGRHLERWSQSVGRERLIIIQFERLIEDPVAVANSLSSQLGLAPYEYDAEKAARHETPNQSSPAAKKIGSVGWSYARQLMRIDREQLVGLGLVGIEYSRWLELEDDSSCL